MLFTALDPSCRGLGISLLGGHTGPQALPLALIHHCASWSLSFFPKKTGILTLLLYARWWGLVLTVTAPPPHHTQIRAPRPQIRPASFFGLDHISFS